LRPDPLTTRVGPLEIQDIEGLRRHRLTLASNESGISFELEFHATMTAHEETPHARRRDGRITENMARAQQLGRYVGWLEFDGRRIDVDSASWLGQRDHSWGVRAEMRSDETSPPLTFTRRSSTLGDGAVQGARAAHLFTSGRRVTDLLSGEECSRGRKVGPQPIVDAARGRGTTTRTAKRWSRQL
jgi:hypothetical protein